CVAISVAGLAWMVRAQAVRGGGREAEALRAEKVRLEEELAAARDAAQARSVELGTMGGRLESLERMLAEREEALEALRQSERSLREATAAERLAAAEARANLEHAERANRQMQAFLDEAQVKLAGKVFEEKGQQFEKNVRNATGQSRVEIEQLLKPFAERIKDFRERVETLYGNEARERASLQGAVTELKGLNQEMAEQALALTRALKGNAKIRGDWGELMLESVLRGSGLEEGVHYERQKSTRDE